MLVKYIPNVQLLLESDLPPEVRVELLSRLSSFLGIYHLSLVSGPPPDVLRSTTVPSTVHRDELLGHTSYSTPQNPTSKKRLPRIAVI